MRIQNYKPPESSFLSLEKDMEILTELFIKNERLKKYIYYTVKDPLSMPKLTDEETYLLFNNNISMVPKRKIDETLMNHIIINFDNFIPNESNPQFRNNIIEFNILCHFDQWQLNDFKLRPFRIAAEIDSMLNNKKLTNIGKLEFMEASYITYNDDFGGINLIYYAIHSGGEDRKGMLNPKDEEQFIKDFNEMFNED